jgi:vitamin B12 transporter
MNRSIFIATCTLLFAHTSLAQGTIEATEVVIDSTAHAPHVALATAVISASPRPVSQDDVARVVTVLDTRDIHAVAPVSLDQILEGAASLDVRNRGGLGVQTDLSIRGGSFEQTGLIVNGVRWSAPHTGHHLMNIPLDPEDLTRVEILHGGASPLWGSGTMTGAISLTSEPSYKDLALVVLEGGQNGLLRSKASVHFGGETSRHRVGLSHLQSDGFQQNTDAIVRQFNYVGKTEGKAGEFKAMLTAGSKAFGAQDFYTASFPTQYEETQTVAGQLTWRRAFSKTALQAGVYSRLHDDRFELFREGAGYYEDDGTGVLVMAGDSLPVWYSGANEHSSTVAGGFAIAHFKRAESLTSLRIDARNEAIASNRLGVADQGRGDVLNLGDSRQIVDATLAHGLDLGDLQATAYASLNAHSSFGATLLPGLDVSYAIGEQTTLFASASKSVRHPSFTDLYYNIGGAVGSIDLTSETAVREEIGARYKSDSGWNFEGAVFARQGRNLIDWLQLAGEDTTRASNLRAVDFSGAEASVYWRNKSQQSGEDAFGLTYIRFGAMLMQASETSDGFTSNYVLDFLSEKVDVQCAFNLPADAELSLQISHQNRLGGYYDPVEDAEVDYAPITLLGLSLSKTFAKANLQAYVRADNALDVQFVDIGNVDQPGRWVRGGLTWFMFRD